MIVSDVSLIIPIAAMPTAKIAAPSIPYDRIRAVEWLDGSIRLIDQRLLPGKLEHLTLRTLAEAVHAIRDMAVRGAPAIGITAAHAVVLAAHARSTPDPGQPAARRRPHCRYPADRRSAHALRGE